MRRIRIRPKPLNNGLSGEDPPREDAALRIGSLPQSIHRPSRGVLDRIRAVTFSELPLLRLAITRDELVFIGLLHIK